MATAVGVIREQVPIAPLPEQNQADALGVVSNPATTKRIIERHTAGLASRRQHDLLSEKLLLHIDGSGDFQYADIWNGTQIEIPRFVAEFRKSENLLRPIIDNAVAHHTTMPLRYFAESSPDRRARDTAMVDAIWANYLAEQQRFNALFAEAMYLAMPAGFCPVHGWWREGQADAYEAVAYGEGTVPGLAPGMIDCFVGNPFDTVFDSAARRGSIHWCTYGRLVPASIFREKFGHIHGVKNLQGTTKIPSAALFQRIAQDWRLGDIGIHGSAVVDIRRGYAESADEMMVVLCQEILPGVTAEYPEGRLQIVGIPGDVDLRRGRGSPRGDGIVVHDLPLPAGDFSWSLFYSHHRGDDVLGKPWVEDLDPIQLDLNIALSNRWEHLIKMKEAPIVGPGGALADDMLDIGGYNYIEVEPTVGTWRPRVMEWPQAVLAGLTRECDEKRRALYTIGGYNAASRGEAPGSRTPYRALVVMQQADSSIHGPVNQRFRESACDFMGRCWKQMKTYGNVPWLIDITGSQYAHLVEPYISNAQLSERPPRYKLVNAFGPSPELRAQEVLELMKLKGADGKVFLTTDEAKQQYPDITLFDNTTDPKAVQRRRARTVASAIHTLAQQVRVQGVPEQGIPPVQGVNLMDKDVQQAAFYIFGVIETKYPRLRDDDLQAHLDTLSEIAQDETADPLARLPAIRREGLFYEWQAMQAGVMPTQATPQGPAPRADSLGPGRTNRPDRLGTARARPDAATGRVQGGMV
jgi:hypothetical protein